MRSHNQCQFIGNLSQDVELKYMPDGSPIGNIVLAVSDDYKDPKTSEDVKRTEWVRITARGKLAEVCAQYLVKGSKIFASGRMRTRKWQDKQTGQDRYSTEINLEDMQMLSPRAPAGQNGDGHGVPAQRPAQPAMADDFDDSIPF